MPDEYDYHLNKRTDRVYISRPFESYTNKGDMRFISKVFDSPEVHQFVKIKGEISLRVTKEQRQEIKAIFYEDSREIKSLTIQRFTRKNSTPHKVSFTFQSNEIPKLIRFLRAIKYIHIEEGENIKIDDDMLDDLEFSLEDKLTFLHENIELVTEIAQNGITKSDVIALAYRKEQLDLFRMLLTDDVFFEEKQQEWKKRGKEAVWQQFFEDNPWIFGYGLNFIFTSPLEDRNLEQIVSGTQLGQSGKRVDALMKTRGLISSLCFVEIKTHKTKLLYHQKAYRTESWRVSDELSGSVAQIQKTVQKAVKSIGTKAELHNNHGDPTGERAFLYQPKSYVVIGNLAEFQTEYGINEQKFSSFELFRQNLTNPEIITFDELLERAKFIIQHSEYISGQHNSQGEINEKAAPFNDSSHHLVEEEDEIPF